MIDRRDFLRFSAAGALLTGAGASFYGTAAQAGEPAPETDRVPCDAAGFVANARNGVIHHVTTCKDHLPVDRSLPSQLAKPGRRHEKVAAALLAAAQSAIERGERAASQVLAEGGTPEEAKRQRRIEDLKAIGLLNEAIAVRPFCYHLYDKLIRVYGRQKQYDDIRVVLARAKRLAVERGRPDARVEFASREAACVGRAARARYERT